MLPSVPALRAAEQQLARTYDRQHRLRLTQQIARILLVLLGALFAAVLVPSMVRHEVNSHLPQLGILAAMEGVFAVALVTGASLARRGRANLASGVVMVTTTIGACGLALFANLLLETAKVNTMAGLLALIVAIIVAGLLGSIRWMLATTIFLNAFTIVAVLLILPAIAPATSPGNPGPLIIIELGVQWICATLLSYNQFYFQQTIRALSTAQASFEQAQQLDDLKDQFISSVNHELRNPIMAMMNYVTILRQRNREMAPERRASYLDSLDDTGRRVIQLIGSILDLRQMAQHPEDFEPSYVPLKESLVAASRLLDPSEARMTERDLYVAIPEDVTIWGNEVYLQQIFTNLLSNAIKYSAPGTAIEVGVQRLAADKRLPGAPVEITIRDFGLGVPASQIPLLFHRFARLPRDLTSSTSGNGLGLYLCKVLTEAMGGQIWVESSGVEGEGSTFHIVLHTQPLPVPIAAAAPPALVMGRWPVRQARAVLAGGVALAVLAAALVITQQPPTTPITGDLHFIDIGGGYSNGVIFHLTGLGAPANDSHYQAWLIDAASEQITNLGTLTAHDGGYELAPGSMPPNSNLLATGSEVEVTLEHQQAAVPTGQVLFVGRFPPKALVHIRHLLVGFPATPAKVGLLVGVLQQAQVLAEQTRILTSTSPQAGPLSQCVIQSELIVIEGKSAPALPASCATLGIPQGDGFGLLSPAGTTADGYLVQASNHAALALQQPDVTAAMHEHGVRVLTILADLKTQVVVIDALLHQLATQFDATQIAVVSVRVQALVGAPIGPGAGPPHEPATAPDTLPSTAFAAYGEGQQMTDFAFTYRPTGH